MYMCACLQFDLVIDAYDSSLTATYWKKETHVLS